MPTVRLSDIVEPAVYADYDSVNSFEKSAFVKSGIVAQTPALNDKANSGGKILDVPFWKDLANSEPELSSDDPTQVATPEKVGTGMQIARVSYLNKSWSATDLASEIAGSNAMNRIKDRVESWWTRATQARLMAAVTGVLADNLAADGGDMVSDISTTVLANVANANLFSRKAFTGAAFTLGDAFENTSAMAVHSLVYKQMVDNDDIDFIKDSEGKMTIATFMGRRVIIDDSMPVLQGAGEAKRYVTALFGSGAIGFGAGSASTPVEVTREALQGNGGGVEIITTRKVNILHPFGYQFTSASVAGVSPSIAELKDAANWARVVDRKGIPLAFLITNG